MNTEKIEHDGSASKIGRPRKLVPSAKILEQLAELGRVQCTQKEAAGAIGVPFETLATFLQDNEAARNAWESGRERGLAWLRQALQQLREQQ